MAGAAGRRSDREGDEPSQRPAGRRLRRLACGGLVACGCGVVAVGLLAAHQPAFYRDRAVAAPAAEADGRRLVTKASALLADVGREGGWGAVITEPEINGWLATDLPRNHGRLLPAWLAAPRVAIGPRRLRVGARVAAGMLAAVVWIDAEVVLRDVNQLGLVVRQARLGGLPLPRGSVIRAIAGRIDALGLHTDVRRLDGGPLLVVYIPRSQHAGAASHWLESFALAEGECLVAGATRAVAAPGR